MSTRPNVTYPTALVLESLARGYAYGFDIMDATGLPSGTIYPLLRRLEGIGCVEARWESETLAARDGRPARKYYRITSAGEELLVRAKIRFAALSKAFRSGRTRPSEGAPAW
ncbi:MAG: PadR family transcriptional regulator [Gemmatimonadaceae bacterium]